MHFKKFRWSKDYEAAEEELELFLDSRGHDLRRCELPADSDLLPARLDYQRQIWCAEGSMQLLIGSQAVTVQPGDGVVIDSNQDHNGHSGVAGCVWYEK